MKILKYILYIVLTVLIIFLVVGIATPEIEYENSVTTDKSIAETWGAMNNEANMSKWLPGYESSEVISGTEGTIGAVSNITFNQNGEKMVIKETIKEIVPNEKIAMDFDMDFMTMGYQMETRTVEGKTEISSKSVVTGNGFIARCMVAISKSRFVNQEQTNLENLKKVIEGEI